MVLLPIILLSAGVMSSMMNAPVPPRAHVHPARRAGDIQRTWSDQDIPLLRENAPISIIGSPAPVANGKSDATATGPVVTLFDLQQKNPHWYAAQMQMLQQRLNADESQIRKIGEIRATGDGISGAIPLDKNAPGLSPETTVRILQNDQNSARAGMNELEDLARVNAIEPGVLR